MNGFTVIVHDDTIVVVDEGRQGPPGKIGTLETLPASQVQSADEVVAKQNGEWVRLSWDSLMAATSEAATMAVFSTRTDFVTELLMYRGEAAPGSVESDPVWRIKRIEFGLDGDVTECWAGGSAGFSYRWSERDSLTYL